MKKRRRDLQIVFQDPFGSLNPRHKVRTLIGEPLTVHGEAGVRERFPDARFHGDPAHRLPNTTNFALPGFDAQSLLAGLDRLGVACSVGSACTSGEIDASHVLRAMGVGDEEARSSLRFSFSRMNSAREVPAALAALEQAASRLAPRGLGD
jgi:cysteine desulfurase